MKAVKILLFAIGFLIAALLIAGLIAPRENEISRSVNIKAPASAIYPHIQYFDKMVKWHPFLKKDPALKVSVAGEDGNVGAVRIWNSEMAIAGQGSDEIIEMTPPNLLVSKVKMTQPRSSEGTNTFQLSESKSQTTVTWSFKYEVPFPFNAFMLFSDDKSGLEDYFTDGLIGLKNTLERFERSAINYGIGELDFQGGTFVMREGTFTWSELEEFRRTAHDEITSQVESLGLTISGPPVGLIKAWPSDDQIKYSFGVPVLSADGIPEEQVTIIETKPNGKVTFFHDKNADMKQAHRFVQKKLSDDGFSFKYPIIEEFKRSSLTGQEQLAILLFYEI